MATNDGGKSASVSAQALEIDTALLGCVVGIFSVLTHMRVSHPAFGSDQVLAGQMDELNRRINEIFPILKDRLAEVKS